jgi:membrane-associated phospholipid phosphatase
MLLSGSWSALLVANGPSSGGGIFGGSPPVNGSTQPSRVALRRGRLWYVLATALFGSFGLLLIAVRRNRTAALDLAITLKVQSRTWSWLAWTMSAVSWSGFPPQSRLLPPLLALVEWRLGFPTEARFQLLAWGTTVLSGLTKFFMHRARPSQPAVRVVVANLGGSSFPSGHVINYIGTYGFLAYCVQTLVRPAALRRPLVGALGLLMLLVGPSRIYQGHHWPTDVLASYLLGLSYLIGVISRYRRAKARELAAQS